jgi:prepilin-type N-terminal cleavage/methylation domain-containing protein
MVNNEKGWTLTELLIVVAIIGVTTLLLPQILSQTTKIFILSRAKLELQREARAAIYVITRELRQAQSSTIIIDQTGGQPYYSRLRFTTVSLKNVTVSQNNNQLQLTVGTDVTILSKNLTFLSFTFPRSDDMTIISVALTLQEQIYGGAYKALHMASERVRVMNP